jgi:integrase
MGKIADFSAWLLAKGTSPTTADLYCRILRDYIQYNGRDTPDERSVSDWTRELLRTNSPRTVNLKLSAVAKFCAFCGVHIRINRPKVQKRLYIDHLLTLDEVQMLISGLSADGHKRIAVIALLLAKSGGRVSEIIRLRKSDLERGYADMDTKGKVRRIYLPTKKTSP